MSFVPAYHVYQKNLSFKRKTGIWFICSNQHWTSVLLICRLGIDRIRTAIEFILVVEWGWDRKLQTNQVLKFLMITIIKIITILQTLIS